MEDKLRKKELKIRVNAEEYIVLRKKAYESNQPIASYIRSSALGKEIKQAISSEDLKTMRSIAGVGNNLNQLMRVLYKGGIKGVANDIDALLSELNTLLNKR